jgi:hypothetical protein
MAYSLVFRASDRTLSDETIAPVMLAILASLETQAGAGCAARGLLRKGCLCLSRNGNKMAFPFAAHSCSKGKRFVLLKTSSLMRLFQAHIKGRFH